MTEHCQQTQRDCPWDKEMIIQHGELLEGLRGINKMVEAGFDGIHKRLDTQNGRIAKSETNIEELSRWRWKLAGGLSVGFAIVLAILKWAGVSI
jgi:hypothetical protein